MTLVNTISGALAVELRELNEQVVTYDGECSRLQAEADALVESYRVKGVNPLTDATAFSAVEAAYSKADAIAAKATALRDRGSTLIGTAVAGPGGLEGFDLRGLGPGSAPFGLTTDGLEYLRKAAERGQFGRFAPEAAVTLGNFPPASRESYDLNVHALLQETTRIADYIPGLPLETASKTYYRVTTGATAAAPVAPGADKPESSPVLEDVTERAKKIAHFGSVHDEIVKDFSAWAEVLGVEFVNGLISAENEQLLSGDGTGENQLGLLEVVGSLLVTRDTTNETRLAALARADAELRNGGAKTKPTVRIMNPTDALETRLETDDNGQFLAGPPSSGLALDFWNVRTVETTDMPEGTAIVANLGIASRIYWREVPVFEYHPDGGGLAEWKANTTLVRAEERLVHAIVRPAAICVVELL